MAQASSPSDYDFLNSAGAVLYSPDYNTGQGYYTSVEMVSDLLQIPSFTGSTNPTEAQVGAYIKRIEDYVFGLKRQLKFFTSVFLTHRQLIFNLRLMNYI